MPNDATKIEESPKFEELTKRVAELEAELARVTLDRDLYRKHAYDTLRADDPYVSPTPAEIHQMLNGPYGEPLDQIIAEFDRRLGYA